MLTVKIGTSESNYEARHGGARSLESRGRDLGPERSSQSTNVVPQTWTHFPPAPPILYEAAPPPSAPRTGLPRLPAAAPWARTAWRAVCFSACARASAGRTGQAAAASAGNAEWTLVLLLSNPCVLPAGATASLLRPTRRGSAPGRKDVASSSHRAAARTRPGRQAGEQRGRETAPTLRPASVFSGSLQQNWARASLT